MSTKYNILPSLILNMVRDNNKVFCSQQYPIQDCLFSQCMASTQPGRMCCTYIRPYMAVTLYTTQRKSTQGHWGLTKVWPSFVQLVEGRYAHPRGTVYGDPRSPSGSPLPRNSFPRFTGRGYRLGAESRNQEKTYRWGVPRDVTTYKKMKVSCPALKKDISAWSPQPSVLLTGSWEQFILG